MFRCVIQFSGKFFTKTHLNVSPLHHGFKTSRMYMVNQSEIYDSCLSVVGLSEKQSADMLLIHPEILSLGNDKLLRTIDVLMKCQFGQKELLTLIISHPYILCVEPNSIELIYQNLSTVSKKSLIYKILLNSPNIINEAWSEVERKISYLEKKMLATQSEIANSGALNYSFNHIKQRHTFLYKVGGYKKLSPKMMPNERQKINPGLHTILNTSNHEFATKVSGVSLGEFEVYQQMCESDDDF